MGIVDKAEATIYGVLHELIDHSTLGNLDQARLRRSVDVLDPAVEADAIPAVPETPEEELARLRAESAARAAGQDPVPATVPVTDQLAAGVRPGDTVTVADQRTGTPSPIPVPVAPGTGLPVTPVTG
jgi:hypothetical protein